MRYKNGTIVHTLDIVEYLRKQRHDKPGTTFIDTHFLISRNHERQGRWFTPLDTLPLEETTIKFYERMADLIDRGDYVVTQGVYTEFTDRTRHDAENILTPREYSVRQELEDALQNNIFSPVKNSFSYMWAPHITTKIIQEYFPSNSPNDKIDAELFFQSFYEYLRTDGSAFVFTNDPKLRKAIKVASIEFDNLKKSGMLGQFPDAVRTRIENKIPNTLGLFRDVTLPSYAVLPKKVLKTHPSSY